MRGPIAVAVSVLVVMAGVSVIVLAGHGWDPMAFVLPRPVDIPPTQTWGVGYDGRFAYAIAVDPFGSTDGLDVPAYRYMRVLYPLAVWVTSLGQRAVVPWMMIVLNLVAAAVTAGLLGLLASRRGGNAAAALVLILSFNYLIGLRFDLNEPLAFALALAGLLAYERGRLPIAIVSFASAALTKEVSLAFPLALAVWSALSRRWRESLLLAVGSLGPYLLWGVIIDRWLGQTPFGSLPVGPTFPPFVGLLSVEGIETRTLIGLWAAAPAALAILATAWFVVRAPRGEPVKDALLVLANAGVVATLPNVAWIDPLAVLRMAIGLMIAIVLWLSGTRPRLLGFAFALWAPSLLLAFLIPGFLS